MNCKNCIIELTENDNYCNNCGAKVVKERITIKSLFSNFLEALGWDSNFFTTIRYLISKPQIIIKEYINGTRKKYTNPFTFFAISLTISLFVFSHYSEQLFLMSSTTNLQQTNEIESVSPSRTNKQNNSVKLFGSKNKTEFLKNFINLQLKYYNLISFLSLPLLTLIAYFVFGKPYNYGEHLIINTYFQSITTFIGVVLFIFALLTKINLFKYAEGVTFLYYSYAYKKIYELSFGKLLLKILKFFGILLLLFFIFIIIIVILAFKNRIN